MTTISITIPGVPRGKGRHRTRIVAGRAHSYTPEQTRNAEAFVTAAIAIAAGFIGFWIGHRKRRRDHAEMRADLERIGEMCRDLCAAERPVVRR